MFEQVGRPYVRVCECISAVYTDEISQIALGWWGRRERERESVCTLLSGPEKKEDRTIPLTVHTILWFTKYYYYYSTVHSFCGDLV